MLRPKTYSERRALSSFPVVKDKTPYTKRWFLPCVKDGKTTFIVMSKPAVKVTFY